MNPKQPGPCAKSRILGGTGPESRKSKVIKQVIQTGGVQMRGIRSVGVALAVLVLVAALASGCGKSKSTSKTTTPGTTKTAPSTTPQSQVVPKDQQVIYSYYGYINDKHYQAAYDLTSDGFKSHYASFAAFEASYRDYVSSVKVVSLTRLDQFSTNQRIEYQAVYDATYIKPYPGGGGVLPPINVVVPDTVNANHWLLDEIGTGP